ncbi:hypothetical protein E4U32_000103 [Claviceps aff. humidiphila group G2b]|nr:hypothetical protein E4U32_000103 [Claviceps aff. humidiphila group G2b]
MTALAYGRDVLHQTAADVIAILKTIPEFRDSKIAVIGGLALWKYLSKGRTTEVSTINFALHFTNGPRLDVDFIVNIDSAPHGVKNRLLALENSPFVQIAQTFYYQGLNGRRVQVDVTHRDSIKNEGSTGIKLSAKQKEMVEPYIVDVVENGKKTEKWWRENLGL